MLALAPAARARRRSQAVERHGGQGHRLSAQAAERRWQLGQGRAATARRYRRRPDRPAADRQGRPRRSDGREGPEVHRIAHQSEGEKHIAGKDPRVQLQNYVTCVNVLALVSAKRDSYKAVIADAAKFLRNLQWDEGEGKNRQGRFLRRRRLRQQIAAGPVQHAVLPRRPEGGRRAQGRSGLQEGDRSSSAAARTSRARTTISRGPARSTTAASSTAPPAADRPRRRTSPDPRRRPARLRQHDLRRHQEPDLLRRLQGRSAHQEGVRVDSEELHAWTPTPACRKCGSTGACTTTITRWPSAWTRWASIR